MNALERQRIKKAAAGAVLAPPGVFTGSEEQARFMSLLHPHAAIRLLDLCDALARERDLLKEALQDNCPAVLDHVMERMKEERLESALTNRERAVIVVELAKRGEGERLVFTVEALLDDAEKRGKQGEPASRVFPQDHVPEGAA